MRDSNIIRRMTPVAFRVQVAEFQFLRQSQLDARYRAGNLSGHKLESAERSLVIKKDSAHTEHPVSLAVIPGQLKARHFADAIGRARVKGRRLPLWYFLDLAEHFARTGEIETAIRAQLPESRQHVVRAVDIGIHGRETIGKTLCHKTLSGKVVTFVELVTADHVKD